MIGTKVVLKQNDYNIARERNEVFDGLFAPGVIGTISDYIEDREQDFWILIPGYEYPFYFYAKEFEVIND